jgi:heme/copper-type cytochrome/quinol oxidase subunit 4
MIYLLAIIDIVLAFLCGLSLYNIYGKETNGFLEMIVLIIGVILIFITNIGILWVSFSRSKEMKSLKKELKLHDERQKESIEVNDA